MTFWDFADKHPLVVFFLGALALVVADATQANVAKVYSGTRLK